MILKGVSRKDGGQLASYLLSTKNEQVQVIDVRGTIVATCDPQGLKSALRDMDEYGKMTRGEKTIFHLAVNPAESDRLTKDEWIYTVDKAEKALGLTENARAVVSHNYRGKEHYHVVWSRVDVERRKCVPLSFTNLKLCGLARELELELGLQQVPGPTRKVHQPNREVKTRVIEIEKFKSQRSAPSSHQIKQAVVDAWQRSENGREFQTYLGEAGLRLVKGDRGPLVLDHHNEAYSPARLLDGITTRDVRAKCADIEHDLSALVSLRSSRNIFLDVRRTGHMVRDEFQSQIANDRVLERGRERGFEPSL